MDVILGNIFQVNTVYLCGIIDIELHPGSGGNIGYILWNFEYTASVFDPERFHGRGDGKADCFFGPFKVRNDKVGSHRVKLPLRAFHGSVEGF